MRQLDRCMGVVWLPVHMQEAIWLQICYRVYGIDSALMQQSIRALVHYKSHTAFGGVV